MDNSYHRFLKKMTEKLNIEKMFFWLDYLSSENVSIFLQNSYIAVFPFREGFSLRRSSVLAAIQNELPVITTSTKALPKPFIEDENIIVATGNPESLAEKVIELIKNENLYNKLKKNTISLAEQFNWQSIAKKYLESFHV